MSLPIVSQSLLDVRPINWDGLPRRYMHEGELEVLVALVKPVRPSVMIEIGVNEGRTANAMLQNVPSLSHYIGIDVERGYVTAKKVQRKEVPDRPGILAADDNRFELITKPRGSFDLSADDLPDCDVVFIDGDHGREAVKHDTKLAEALVRTGGLIVWHDYHELGTVDVKDVLDERASKGFDLRHIENTWLVFERR